MSKLLEIKDVDRKTYEEELKDFLPSRIIDIHTHLWVDRYKKHEEGEFNRVVSWPSRVAKENPIEDHIECYRLMFPDKEVIPMCFSSIKRGDDIEALNNYVSEACGKHNYPALLFSPPWWSAEEFENKVKDGGFLGAKVYLNLSPEYIPMPEIRIFDFLPHHFLEVLNRNKWIVMLHIPRNGRLKDPVNLEQMLEIEEKYPDIKLIIAHVGRAYCKEDVDNAFEVLKPAKKMLFDFSANTNAWVFEQLIKAVGPKRVLFGSDLPILRMRMRRICEDGRYINIVPKGLYGDVSGDKNMREVEGKEAEKLTFFMYEELKAFKQAAEATGLSRAEIEDIFFNNAKGLINSVKRMVE